MAMLTLLLPLSGVVWAAEWAPIDSLPGPRRRHVMVYDDARGRLVVFGGLDSLEDDATALGNTLEWDGTRWREVARTGPAPRKAAAMVYDSHNERALLFGGYDASVFRDTWAWDGSSWRQLTPQRSPSNRASTAMAYDSVRRRVVLFGGAGGGQHLNDTWEFDGANWTAVTPSGSGARSPEVRASHAMVYDPLRRKTVLFGGLHDRHSTANTIYDDTWEWDGTTWSEVAVASKPAPRFRHGMVYDAARQRVVLFGGFHPRGSYSDTWQLDGSTWTQLKDAPKPGARGAHGMAYDERRDRIVVAGGQLGTKSTYEDAWARTETVAGGDPSSGDAGPPADAGPPYDAAVDAAPAADATPQDSGPLDDASAVPDVRGASEDASPDGTGVTDALMPPSPDAGIADASSADADLLDDLPPNGLRTTGGCSLAGPEAPREHAGLLWAALLVLMAGRARRRDRHTS